jgi:tRNA pseudouridine55 synthase
MTVTSGFYVRSLCHDLGAAVGSLGCMAALVRSRQGDFELGKNVFEYADLAQGEEHWAPKVRQMLDDWTEERAAAVAESASKVERRDGNQAFDASKASGGKVTKAATGQQRRKNSSSDEN